MQPGRPLNLPASRAAGRATRTTIAWEAAPRAVGVAKLRLSQRDDRSQFSSTDPDAWISMRSPCPARPPVLARGPQRLRPLAVDDARRAALEDFVRGFAAHYRAQVRHFMPRLFALEAADGNLHGAVGCRGAADEALPRTLSRRAGRARHQRGGRESGVERDGIVEVGNLAAHGAGTRTPADHRAHPHPGRRGLRWVCFTGTPALINSFRRLGLDPLTLGPADPRRMGPELPEWAATTTPARW